MSSLSNPAAPAREKEGKNTCHNQERKRAGQGRRETGLERNWGNIGFLCDNLKEPDE